MAEADLDVDEALLALDGSDEEGEAGSENGHALNTGQRPSSSSSPAPPPPPAPTVDAAGPTKGIARKKAKVRGGVTKRASPADFEDDEESSAPQSPNSLGSGAMSESESDNEPAGRPVPSTESTSGTVTANPFPIDGKFKSQKDKDELMSLPEARREQILSERAEELEKTNFSRALKERMQVQQIQDQSASDKKKRKAGAADLDDGPRTSSRPKTKATENLENYKRQREQRHERLRHGGNNGGRKSPLRRPGSSNSSDGRRGDIDWDDEPRLNNTRPRQEPPASLRDFNRCRIGRTNFAKVCYVPGFEETLTGCFVRVSVGFDQKTRTNIYKMGQIKEFVSGKPYIIEDEKGHSLYMDLNIVAAHGKMEKEQRFVHCSDSQFTEAELDEYRKSLDKDGMRFPTLGFINSKLDQINALIDYPLKDAEISERLRRNGKRAISHGHVDLSVLLKQREEAIKKSDEAEIAKIDKEVADIERKRNMLVEYGQRAEAQTKRVDPAQRAREERLAKIQEANRKAELEASMKAREESKRRLDEKRAKLARGKAEREAKLRKEAELKAKQEAGEGLDELFDEDEKQDEKKDSKEDKPTTTLPKKSKKMDEEEILQSLDFELDIDI